MYPKIVKKVFEKHGRSLDITANIASTVATRNPKAGLSTLHEVIIIYHTGKGLYFMKFVYF